MVQDNKGFFWREVEVTARYWGTFWNARSTKSFATPERKHGKQPNAAYMLAIGRVGHRAAVARHLRIICSWLSSDPLGVLSVAEVTIIFILRFGFRSSLGEERVRHGQDLHA